MKLIAVVCNREKPNVTQLAEGIAATLAKWDITCVVDSWLSQAIGAEGIVGFDNGAGAVAEAVIVLGGDGTILNVARQLVRAGKQIPVLGVNLGRFGFLAEVTVPELHEALESLRDGSFPVSKRSLLDVRVRTEEKIRQLAPAVNEVVTSRQQEGRLGVLTMHIDGEWVTTYPADGIILSTTTGSTAHSMAAGGPIVYPEVSAWVVTPICPHTLGVRAMVVPNESVVEFRSERRAVDLQVTIDGQEQYALSYGEVLEIRKHEIELQLVTSKRRTFYEILRKKFNLGDTWSSGDSQ